MVGRSGAPSWDARTRCPDAPVESDTYPCLVSRRPSVARRRSRAVVRFALAGALFAVALATLIAGCSDGPAVSFDPTSPCSVDGSAPGAYPDLEARIPTMYEGRGPDMLDSGRHCSAENLGFLAEAGITEVRFAGGTWDLGGYRAAALIAFEAPGLEASQIAIFYAESARTSNRTTITAESYPTLAGRPGHRLDTRTGDRTQTVVVWPATATDTVNVVISNDLPDPKILAAVDAFAGR